MLTMESNLNLHKTGPYTEGTRQNQALFPPTNRASIASPTLSLNNEPSPKC